MSQAMREAAKNLPSLPTSPEDLLEKLKLLGIDFTRYDHEAVFTVAESEKISGNIPGLHTRNMFLRTKKKANYLVTLSDETPIDIKKLEKLLEVGRFSFGSPERLHEILGVHPGSVTPLSVINADPENITVILEKKMMDADLVAYHPLINTITITMTPQSLLAFMADCGITPRIVDLSTAAPEI